MRSTTARRLALAGSLLTMTFPLTLSAQPKGALTRDVELAGVEDTELKGELALSIRPGDPLTVKLKKPPRHGILTLDAATGAFTFTPARDYAGDDTFTVDVGSGKQRGSSKVTLHFAPENDAPTAQALQLFTVEDAPARGTLLASDVDRDLLTFRISTPPSHGAASVDAKGAVAFRPAQDWNGADAFSIEVSDGALTATAEVRVTVAPVNDAPIVRAAPQPCREDEPCTARIDASDADADALTYKLTAKPKHGELLLDADTGAFTFTPARDFHGDDAFSVEVSDGKLKASAALRLLIAAINDAPVPAPLSLQSSEDTEATGRAAASDIDGDALTWRIASPPAHGVARVDARRGSVSYVPAADYHGPDAFTLSVSDGETSSTSQVSVALSAVDDAPRLRAMTLETNEDTNADGLLPGYDVDGDALTFRIVGQPRLGAALLSDASSGAFRVHPLADAKGDDSFSFEVTDGRTTVNGTVAVRVRAVNDAPVVAELQLATREDEPVEGLAQGFDVDGDALSWSIASPPKQGKASVDANGRVRFEPAKDQYGAVSFTVKATDAALSSQPARVTVSIAPVNDAPIARRGSLSTDEDLPARGALAADDVDLDTLAFALARPPEHGTVVVLDASKGLYSYTPAANWFGSDTFAFSATDGSGAISFAEVGVSVAAVNDAPVAEDDHITGPCQGMVSGRLHGFDRENRSLTYRVVKEPRRGRVRLDEKTGEFSFYTEAMDDEPVSFAFEVFDGQAASAPADLVVHPSGSCTSHGG